MRNFLEELYSGNLDPQARGYRKDRHIRKISDNVNEPREKVGGVFAPMFYKLFHVQSLLRVATLFVRQNL